MANYTSFSGTINNSANADSSVLDLGNSDTLAVYVKSDKALTGKVYVTPARPIDAGFNAATADWYKVGSDLAVAANTNLFQDVTVVGGGAAKINFANASGATATVSAILRASPRRPVH